MLQGPWPNMFTGARKDGGVTSMEVVKIWSSFIHIPWRLLSWSISLLHCFSSDLSKNELAYGAIDSLLRDCCWMNVHVTQPFGPVFEIRVQEGYGARWSQDGSKVQVGVFYFFRLLMFLLDADVIM